MLRPSAYKDFIKSNAPFRETMYELKQKTAKEKKTKKNYVKILKNLIFFPYKVLRWFFPIPFLNRLVVLQFLKAFYLTVANRLKVRVESDNLEELGRHELPENKTYQY